MTKITVAKGDVIGLKIMAATLKFLVALAKELDTEDNVMGEKMYLNDNSIGIYDTQKLGNSHKLAGRQAFVNAVIYRLGQKPTTYQAVDYPKLTCNFYIKLSTAIVSNKKLVGVDVSLEAKILNADGTAQVINNKKNILNCTMIIKSGTKLWPNCFL